MQQTVRMSDPIPVGRLDPNDWLGLRVTVVIDRPIGSAHPEHGFRYETNYGYVPGFIAPDGEALDAYVLGPTQPIETYTGHVLGVVIRSNDIEDKLIVGEISASITSETIAAAIHFQEQWHESRLIVQS